MENNKNFSNVYIEPEDGKATILLENVEHFDVDLYNLLVEWNLTTLFPILQGVYYVSLH